MARHVVSAVKTVNHEQCACSIVDCVADNALTNLVLVGHSYGGTIIAKVAYANPESLDRLVLQNAFVPEAETASSTSFHLVIAISSKIRL